LLNLSMFSRNLVFVFLFALLSAEDDFVESLPNFGKLNQTNYAGFVEVGSHGANMFYWFTASNKDATASNQLTPFIIWINGGPGASSLTGLMVENGPYALNPDGSTYINKYSWTNVGHMIFIDNPVGSGYSYVVNDEGYVNNEQEMATQFVEGLRGFFAKHSDLRKNPLYITGESYAGKYIPHITAEIVRQNQDAGYKKHNINLKAILIGNGLYDPYNQFKTLPNWYLNLGMVDEKDVEVANRDLQQCKEETQNLTKAFMWCNGASDYLNKQAGDIFLYDIRQKDGHAFDDTTNVLKTYLNKEEVKAALHTTGHDWKQGDGTSEPNPVGEHLNDDFMINDTLTLFQPIFDGGVEIGLYVGNMDGSVCGVAAHEFVVQNFHWPGRSDFWKNDRITWKTSDGLVGGYVRQGGNLTYVIIHDSGHLVPSDQPLAAMEMVDHYINKKTFTNQKVLTNKKTKKQ